MKNIIEDMLTDLHDIYQPNEYMTRKTQLEQVQKVLDRCFSIKRHLGTMNAIASYEEKTIDGWITEVSNLRYDCGIRVRRLTKLEMKRLNELWAEINFKFQTIK